MGTHNCVAVWYNIDDIVEPYEKLKRAGIAAMSFKDFAKATVSIGLQQLKIKQQELKQKKKR